MRKRYGVFTRRSNRQGEGSTELCRATVKVPLNSTQQLGHNHQGARRVNEPAPDYALVRLLENGRSSVHNGRYCLVTVGGAMDPFPTFPVDSVVAAYRVFLLVQAVIAAGKMDADGRTFTDEAILAQQENSATRWVTQVVGRRKFLEIKNFPVEKMPANVRELIRRRMSGR